MTASTGSRASEARPVLAPIQNLKRSVTGLPSVGRALTTVREASMDFVKGSLDSLSLKSLPTQSNEACSTGTSDSTPSLAFSVADLSQDPNSASLDLDATLFEPVHQPFQEFPVLDLTSPKPGIKRSSSSQISLLSSDDNSKACSSDSSTSESDDDSQKTPEAQVRVANWMRRPDWVSVRERSATTGRLRCSRKRARTSSKPKTQAAKPKPRHFPLNPNFIPKPVFPLDPDMEGGNDGYFDPEYFFDHVKNFHAKEKSYKCQVDYMAYQRELTWDHRAKLVKWIINLTHRFRLLPSVIYLAVNLLDRFLSVRLASRARVPYTALACLFIAVKFETRLHPPVEQFVKSSGLTLTKQDLMIYEEYVLKVLDFRLGYPNPFQFLGYASLGDGSFLQTRLMARYVMEQCLLSSTLVHCDGALLACAAMHIARKILGRGSWDDKMEHCTGCRREEVVLIAKHMIDFLLVGPTVDGSLEKYSSAEYLRVALIATEWIAKRRTLVDEMAKTKAKADDQAL